MDEAPVDSENVHHVELPAGVGGAFWRFDPTWGLRDVEPAYARGDEGLRIGRVVPYSVAFHMQLKAGDQLVQMADVDCDSVASCRDGQDRMMARARRSSMYSVEVLRDGQRLRFVYKPARFLAD